jgi:hypothetical protein
MRVVVKNGKECCVHYVSEKMRDVDLNWTFDMDNMGKGVECFK